RLPRAGRPGPDPLPFFARRPAPPRPAADVAPELAPGGPPVLVGAHLDNVDNPPDASFRRLGLMRAGIVGTMWTDGTHHRRPVYDRLDLLLDKPVYLVRVGPSGRISPRDWVRQASAALAELPSAAVDEGRVRVRALNDVNLPAEGGWRPEQYADFLAAVRKVARLPKDVALVAAPVSLGLPDYVDWWQR